MPKRFFCSDKHHQHINIIKYENRPFNSIEEMDKKLISYHNEMVKEDDICYDLGDFYFRGGYQAGNKHYSEFLRQYNGRYVIVRGNHERSNKIIDSIQSCTMYLSNISILCLHDPINANTKQDLVLHGHLHSKSFVMELHENNKKSLLINVGVDVPAWKFQPVEWRKLEELYTQWKVGKIKAPIYDKKAVKEYRANLRNKR